MRLCILCVVCCILYFSCSTNKSGEHKGTIDSIELVGIYKKDEKIVTNVLWYSKDTFKTRLHDTNSINIVKFWHDELIGFMSDRLKEPKHITDSLNEVDIYKKEEFIWKVFKANPHIADSVSCRVVCIIFDEMEKIRAEIVASDPRIIQLKRTVDSISQARLKAITKFVW